MSLPFKIVCSLLAVCFLGSCYKDAPEKYIPDETQVDSNETEDDAVRQQNLWTYNQMKSDYFWEAHLPDTARLSFADYPKTFFSGLLYKEDRFSWIEINSDYDASSLYDRYGLEYEVYDTPATDAPLCRALLVRKNSVAERAGMKRGDWFTLGQESPQGVEVETGRLHNSRFIPDGQTLRLEAGRQTRSLEAGDEQEGTGSVELDTIYRTGGKVVGYVFYNEFMDAGSLIANPYRAELRNIFGRFREEGVTELIVDLRYNPGGYVSICQYLGSLILKDEYLGEVSGYHSFNRKLALEQYDKTGNEEEVLYFPSKNAIAGNNLGVDRAYFIITRRTASASESLINSLSPFIGVTKIGSTSTGKGVGSWTIQSREYEWQLQPITFRYYNSQHESVPDSGLTPDIPVDETQAGELYELGDTREEMLRVALEEITGTNLRGDIRREPIILTPSTRYAAPQRKTKGYIHHPQKQIQI
jgi:C-terminal processing protease CtpA/Prc